MKYLTFVCVLQLVVISSCLCSIQKEHPVRVTHSNSGPTYDIDNEVERHASKPTGEREEPETTMLVNRQNQPNSEEDSDSPAIRHVTIRRIFLVPMAPPTSSAGDSDSEPSRPSWSSMPDPLGRANMWPNFLFGPPPPSTRNQPSAGESEAEVKPAASSPTGDKTDDKPDSESSLERPRPMVDPIQLIRDMIQAAHAMAVMNSFGEPPARREPEPMMPLFPQSSPSGELDKAGSNLPSARNETKEEIVEIDGKKFIKKTVINRHVGENIVVMTRRLIFAPLNETDSTPSTVATPVEQPIKETSTSTTTTTTTGAPEVAKEEPVFSTVSSEPKQTSSTSTLVPEVRESSVEKENETLKKTSSGLTSTTTTTLAPTTSPTTTTGQSS